MQVLTQRELEAVSGGDLWRTAVALSLYSSPGFIIWNRYLTPPAY